MVVMNCAPDIAGIAALIGDPARSRLLMALMAGQAMTATELNSIVDLTKQTVSGHLAKLTEARLLSVERQGRHRYFRLADRDVARLLENLMGVAARIAPKSAPRFGPREPTLREARVCYDHLAGNIAVQIFASIERRHLVRAGADALSLLPRGAAFFRELGIDIDALQGQRRPLCRTCLDWSERRNHLAGSLGAAVLDRFYALDWARRAKASRVVTFSALGAREVRRAFELR